MSQSDHILHLAENPFETGQVRFRYERYLAPDGERWIRHGLFREYHPNGQVASEGMYEHGLETGPWRDYYSNGQLAAEGSYREGKETGLWKFYQEDGQIESEEQMDGAAPSRSTKVSREIHEERNGRG